MLSQQKLLSLWVCLLIMAAFCPGAQYVHGKRGGSSMWTKSSSRKDSSSEGHDLSKKGTKLAGAAAAVVGTGYGMGVLGQSRRGSSSSKYNEHFYYNPDEYYNSTRLLYPAAAGAPAPNVSLSLGCVVSLLVAVWVRGM